MEYLTIFKKMQILLIVSILICVSGCHGPDESWRITVGGDMPKEKVFVDSDHAQEVKICFDKKGGSGYPTTVVATFDGNKYAGMIEGQCMFFTGKKVAVRFGTPSSGKFAIGTFVIVDK